MNPRDETDEYSPERVRYYILHWRELAEMAQDTSNGLNAGSTGAASGRITFAIILADLEQVANTLRHRFW